MAKEETPEACKGCVRWEKFGRQCWFYWEGKRFCSQHIKSWDEDIVQP